MVDSDQGGRSSRPLSACQKRKLRTRLRKLDRKCHWAKRVADFQRKLGMVKEEAAALRIYRKADMERMMTRNKIKGTNPSGERE